MQKPGRTVSRPYDAEAAGKAGLRTIGLLCGGFTEEGLRKAGCIAIYKDPADLLAQYDRSPLARQEVDREPANPPLGAAGMRPIRPDDTGS